MKLKEIQQKRITLPLLLELKYSYDNIKCSETFFQYFLYKFILKAMEENINTNQNHKIWNFWKNASFMDKLTSFVAILIEANAKNKLNLVIDIALYCTWGDGWFLSGYERA